MAEGILGLGTSGSSNLNSELLEKLRAVDDKAIIDPITESIDDKQAEIDGTEEFYEKLTALLESIEKFDLYNTDSNAFDSVTATTSGSGVTFDSNDTSNLSPGTISVEVSQLAKKSIYQSDLISDKTATMESGTLSISVGDGSSTIDIDTTDLTYEDLVDKLNTYSSVDASLEQVGDSSYRIVIKSSETGESNKLTMTASTSDLNLTDSSNKLQSAENLNMTVDGVSYDTSSNQVTLGNGLIITGTGLTTSAATITLSRDISGISDEVEDIATKYNELLEVYDKYTKYNEDEDKTIIKQASTLDGIMSTIKNTFYESYGLNDEESAFRYGISFNSDGEMTVDTGDLGDALSNNFDDVKELFSGYAEKKGIATVLTEYIDDLDTVSVGELTKYMTTLSDQLDELKQDKEDETEKLDDKYTAMAERFAEYTTIITEMENSFASFKQMIGADDDE